MSINQVMRPIAMLKSGKYIRIESIYTVINGKQINIQGKVEEIRRLGRARELFCPCGCGINLFLSASPDSLRKQHFKKFPGQNDKDCHFKGESEESLNSKIVLKCWMDDKLKTYDVEDKRAICKVDDIDRKFQFTLLSMDKKIAVSYCRKDFNLSDEKIEVLQSNKSDIKTIYVEDAANGNCEGQYPEYLMKIQKIQNYCLLLTIDDYNYERAKLEAVFYAKDEQGLWERITLANDLLKNYRIEDDGNVLYCGESVHNLYVIAKRQHDERLLRIEEEKRCAEEERKRLEAEARRREEERIAREREEKERLRKYLEEEKIAALKRKEAIQRRKDENASLTVESEKRYEEAVHQCEEKKNTRTLVVERQEIEQESLEEIKRLIEPQMHQQEEVVRDKQGRRWVKCEYCNKIAPADEFVVYGGIGTINLGICRHCMHNNPKVKEDIDRELFEKVKK